MQYLTPANIRCYSRLVLNPFRGAIAVVESPEARAWSRDGRRWWIEVLASPPRDLWAETRPTDGRRYYAFGEWRSDTGLREVPLSPLFDTHAMIQASNALIASLPEAEQQLPFAFEAPHELWLMNPLNKQPLYMIATTEAVSGPLPAIDWRFPDLTGSSGDIALKVSHLLKEMAGTSPEMHWFERKARPSPPLPELPFNLASTDGALHAALGTYLDQLAPHLLTLPMLSVETRRRLERVASAQPEAVARHWRLYPDILDKPLFVRNRVAAQISHTRHRGGDKLSPP